MQVAGLGEQRGIGQDSGLTTEYEAEVSNSRVNDEAHLLVSGDRRD